MTAAGTATQAPAGRVSLPLALSIALRELRAGAGGLIIFVICIALGVTAGGAAHEPSLAESPAVVDAGPSGCPGPEPGTTVRRRLRL